ncbi:MAG TPA: hypothetical protein VKV40_22565 [Ktedonobacteraceae bacterium]|nr:hypothetical protein [Ktedonobacteraceae bacterium]
MAAPQSKIRAAIGRLNPFNKGQSQPSRQATLAPTSSSTASGPTTGPLAGKSGPTLEQARGQINLVNYSPDELMLHVEQTMAGVHFGMTVPEKFKEYLAEFWDVTGPLVLLAGTAGEVFAFIWGYSDVSAWWIGLSILATVIVLEATFAVVSYKSSTIRNRAEHKSGGVTDAERRILARYRQMWLFLALGVGVGQAAFLISALGLKLGHLLILLVAFVVARTLFTLASDFYTAFVHARKPTEGEEAKAQQAQRAALAKDLLHQKSEEVRILNTGILDLQRAHTTAEMEQDKLRTQLEVERLQNQAQIETLKNQAEQARLFTKLGNSLMRAMFDPDLPDEQRQKLLGTMQGFMVASRQLPPGYRHISEEEREEDL